MLEGDDALALLQLQHEVTFGAEVDEIEVGVGDVQCLEWNQRVSCLVDLLELYLSCNVDILTQRVAMRFDCQLGFDSHLGQLGS